MVQFGICTATENAPAVKRAGWDFVEELVQPTFRGDLPDAQWHGAERLRNSPLPVIAANALLPASLKVTGPAADLNHLGVYMERVIRRAAQTGVKTLVFGSGAARMVPDGFDHSTARRQILDFVRMSADLAATHGVLLVAEHLNKGECNIVTSLAEAMRDVKEVNHPNYQCLVDAFHFWMENEPLDSLRDAMPWIKHVHMADVQGRKPCGETGQHDYKAFFRILKDGGYNGPISMESFGFDDFDGAAPRILTFLKSQWAEA